MSEIKECPFCGSEDTVRLPYNDRADVERCLNCNLSIVVPFGFTMWNNRPIEDALRARAERAEQVVERLIVAIELGNDVPLIHEPEITSVQSWYKKMHALVAEWKERQ